MSNNRGLIAVDFDGTLAHYDGWKGAAVLGEPIPRMVTWVKEQVAGGRDVCIFTARIAGLRPADRTDTIIAIQRWCWQHLGIADIEVTNTKDWRMDLFVDDRCKEVIKNTGIFVREAAGLHPRIDTPADVEQRRVWKDMTGEELPTRDEIAAATGRGAPEEASPIKYMVTQRR